MISTPGFTPLPVAGAVSTPSVVQPQLNYWGPQWDANASNYQWEMQNLRRELELAYRQGYGTSHSGNAMVALQGLQDAQTRWAEQDLMNQLQVQHRYAGEAYERLRQAEMKWHEALHQLEAQQHQTAQMEGILHHAEAEAQMSKAGLLEQLNWHRQQLSRAQDEIRRLRPAEAHFTAVTSEVEYLRSQMAHMRELEERFENVSKEADVLRAQLVKQEHNIDRYTHQTESFYQSANNENISIKKQLAAREDELLHLRERFTDAVDEIHHSHDQVRRAEAELKRVRSEADDLNDFVSEAIYLKHQFGDASNQLSRMEDRVERLTAENEHLHAQLDAAEAEIERLSVALGDESKKTRFLEAALNEEIADNKAVRRQLNEAVVHQTHVATAFKQDAAVLSSDVEVKNMEIERLQNRLADVTRELDKYTSMYEEAVVDVDRLKAALTEEITEHKHIRGVAEEQKQKADLALDELHRLGDPARALRQRLAEAEAEVVHLRHVISDQRVEIESLSQPRVVEYIPPQPPSLTMGYSLGDPVVQPALVSPPKGYKFAYFGVEVAEGAFLSKNYGEPAPIPAVRVVNVGGPCKEAGLKPGDLISSILGRQVGTLDDFNAVVSSVAPHTEVKIIFERDGVLLGTDIVTEETKREPGLPGRTPFESNRKGRPNSKKPGK